ncbi:ribose-5-phosphate isomerase RpiA [Enterococcus pseudoavium]|mgnify:FL=1|uniref:Ribose-5-phosphate isomerase A n=1 Tax=Enterococcus pseudoavium TaxID=44007 RepID=A0AAE4HZB2_9ENTE|nr:ribose-5-phosphate isomerase RpiA [Enterococcus pseudoavium]MDT2736058.1 ribose-5-phosphate isomerase RpiA [Enterococcus pseudoavium]MDT2754160.1 ribose-5-phosphate isomerase RpiA [Enterococcus pseudoavium]MDT2770058.1 ribose-5-phosphate isomerase RpiA [Enterococcus pseudoavium]REC32831.1 ribose 5-phosphate isomerase A [Enterococcus pseudoavium]
MNLKELVGIEAAKFVKDGMIVGLGTGSTAYYLVKELGRRVNEEGLKITGVVTSSKTEEQAKALGIPLKAIDDVESVDLTIDGADEISDDFQGIKGGGAALLFEKVVATYSKDCIWIVDESKMVNKLGNFPLPVEVVPFGSHNVFRLFEEKGYHPTWRKTEDGELLNTDGGHHIIDLHLEVIEDPRALAEELDTCVGVVEHGLFIDMISRVIVGTSEGPKILTV